MTLQFERPPGYARLEDEATLAVALAARFARGEHVSEWEIGDALNQLGGLRARDVALFLRSECLPRNRDGGAYTLARLVDIAAISARFPDDRRGPPISFSHYEDLWRGKVRTSLCGVVLDIAVRHGLEHKRARDVTRDVKARARIGEDGFITVPAMERWGTAEVRVREATDDVQATLLGS